MLSYLHVKNIALIDEAEVEFGSGLNILTGETGAGKSILMGSVNLALGQKMSKTMLRNPEEPALVELVFQVDNPKYIEILKTQDISMDDGQIIISRKLTGNRSISRLNGEICTAAQIREISSLLLDIHGQHEHQSLLYQEHQLQILDAYGKEQMDGLKAEVLAVYKTWMSQKKELETYQLDEDARKREIAFLEFEIQEIEEAQLVPGEDEELEKRYKTASNSKKIIDVLSCVYQYTGNDNGAGDMISRSLQEINRIEGFDEQVDQIGKLLADMESLIYDVNHELTNCMDQMTFSDEEFYQMDQRLNILNHLKSKYGSSIDAVLQYQKDKQKELDRLYHYEAYKEELERKLEKTANQLDTICQKLTSKRQECAKQLEVSIIEGLSDLNFLDVQFVIQFEPLRQFTALGKDKIEFLISTNPGEPVRSLGKVVSGGELSRIMLAIKTILADKDETETLIFDEIDTGISGRTAQKVSEKMAVIGKSHQVICITHLPQIAAMADYHFEIEKSVENGETTTKIHRLSQEESVNEIARILGGAEITEHTKVSAAEMKDLAQKLKNASVRN